MESYPPLFRQLIQDQTQNNFDPFVDTEPTITNHVQEDSDPIPTINLQSLNQEELREACKDWGLFHLVNHGIPSTLLDQLQDQAKAIFSLSFESKKSTFNNVDNTITYFWGTPALTPSGTALVTEKQNINWVEGFNVPMNHLSQFQTQNNPILESFRLLFAEYGNHLYRISTTLFKAMVDNLNLNIGKEQPNFSSLLSEPTGALRIYRYPHYSNHNPAVWGMEGHTDSSVLTILHQDQQVSGLQVLKQDQWLTINPMPNSLIVNLGDMMQVLSDDEYKSVTHRVKLNKNKERTSICYFVFPDEDYVIKSSSKYKPFTYKDFRAQVQQDIKTIGRKVGLERFKLTEEGLLS